MKITIKDSKGQAMTPLVGAFIAVMISVVIAVAVVIPTIQDQVTSATSLANATELNVNSKNGTTLTLAYGDILNNTITVFVTNGTSDPTWTRVKLTSGNYTSTAGSANTKATISWASTVNVNTSLANVTYLYYPSTYIKSTAVITLLNLLPLFIVLAVLVGVVALVKF